jgi:hypothetical protein
MTIDTPEQMQAFHLLRLKGMLKLETKGMKISRGKSAYTMVKEMTGLKGNKQKVYDAYVELLKDNGILQS